MLKRTSIVFFLAVTLVFGSQAGRQVHGVAITSEELSLLSSPDLTNDARSDKSKKDGNDFVRALKAPFRALGRLFGGKKNDSKLQRISAKDLKRFESIPSPVVTDATKPARETISTANPVSVRSDGEYAARVNSGRNLLAAGDFDGAVAELSRAASLDPKSAEVRNLLGIAYEGKGMRARALESFKAAVEADKDNAEYLNNYGFLLFKNHDFSDATKYLKRAAKVSPNDARIWNNLGLAQCAREKFDEAFQSFLRAGDEFDAHVNMAAQLYSHGEAKAAIKHLETARAMRPNSAEVLAKLVSLYEMTGRPSDAEAARRSIVALRTFADAKR